MRCATSSPWPGRRPPTPTSPGTSSSAAPTSSWPTSGATWSTGRSRWPTRTTARSRRPGRCPTIDHQLLDGVARRLRHRRRAARPQPVQAGHRRGDAGGRGGQQVPLRHRAVEAGRRSRSGGTPCCTPPCRWSPTSTPCSRRSCRTPPRRCTRPSAAPASGRPQPEIREVSEEGGPDYPVIMGDYAGRAGPLGVAADHARHAAGQADPAVHQAGRVAGPDRPGVGADRGLTACGR